MSTPNQDLRTVQHFLLEQIRHEDGLFAQRTYALLTAHAFLALAFVSGAYSKNYGLWIFSWFLATFGFLLSLFQAALGHRTHRAIQFWRSYLQGIENETRGPLYSAIDMFYKEKQAEVPVGVIRGDKKPRMNEIYPWRSLNSTNVLLGIVLPFSLAVLWAVALGALIFDSSYQARYYWLPVVVVAGILVLVLVTWRGAPLASAEPKLDREGTEASKP